MTKTNLILIFTLMISAIFILACGDNSSNTGNYVNRTNISNSNMTNSGTNSSSNSNMTNSGMNNSTSSNMNSANSNVAVVQDNFWVDAAQGGMAEVELAKLAQQKSQNAEVKKFAQMMITDHSKANDELKSIAAKKNITLPTDIGSHKSTLDELSKLSGAEFDKEYVEAMVDDHEEDVEMFESKSSSSDADIKSFASKTLPTLKKHLEAIKAIQSKMK
jgi:putative membrane protein